MEIPTDSFVHFGEVDLAMGMARRSDFSLVIGSSLRVAPSNTIPMDKKMARQVCVVNAMDVPFDAKGSIGIRSYGRADVFLFHLMRELDLELDSHPTVSEHAMMGTEV